MSFQVFWEKSIIRLKIVNKILKNWENQFLLIIRINWTLFGEIFQLFMRNLGLILKGNIWSIIRLISRLKKWRFWRLLKYKFCLIICSNNNFIIIRLQINIKMIKSIKLLECILVILCLVFWVKIVLSL